MLLTILLFLREALLIDPSFFPHRFNDLTTWESHPLTTSFFLSHNSSYLFQKMNSTETDLSMNDASNILHPLDPNAAHSPPMPPPSDPIARAADSLILASLMALPLRTAVDLAGPGPELATAGDGPSPHELVLSELAQKVTMSQQTHEDISGASNTNDNAGQAQLPLPHAQLVTEHVVEATLNLGASSRSPPITPVASAAPTCTRLIEEQVLSMDLFDQEFDPEGVSEEMAPHSSPVDNGEIDDEDWGNEAEDEFEPVAVRFHSANSLANPHQEKVTRRARAGGGLDHAPEAAASAGIKGKVTAVGAAKLQAYKQSMLHFAKPKAPPPAGVDIPPVSDVPPLLNRVPSFPLRGVAVSVPASRFASLKTFIVEGEDGKLYRIALDALSAVDKVLFSKRLHFIPFGFTPGPPLGLSVDTNHTPPNALPLHEGTLPTIITTMAVVSTMKRLHFHLTGREEWSPSEAQKTGVHFARPHTIFGPGLHLISLLQKELPRACRDAGWFTAMPICTEEHGNQRGGFVKITYPLPALPFEVDTLPFPVRNLYNASNVFEPAFFEALSAVFLVRAPIDLIVGSPAPLRCAEIPAITPDLMKTGGGWGRPFFDMRKLSGILQEQYEQLSKRPALPSEEKDFFRVLNRAARKLTQVGCRIFWHDFACKFYENAHACATTLRSMPFKATRDERHTGVVLYELDRPVRASSLYIHHPALLETFLGELVSFVLTVVTAAIRVEFFKLTTAVSNSSLGKLYVICDITGDFKDLLPDVCSERPLHAGHTIELPVPGEVGLTPYWGDAPPDVRNNSDEDEARSDDLDHQQVDRLQTETTIYYLLDKDGNTAECTRTGVAAITKIYGKRLAKDSSFEDKTFGLSFRRAVLNDNPGQAALHLFLSTIPNTWAKQNSLSQLNDSLLIKLHPNCSRDTFAVVSEGLRMLPSVSTLYPGGAGTVIVGRISLHTREDIVKALRPSNAVSYYVHQHTMIIGSEMYARELTDALFPPPVQPVIREAAITGLLEDSPIDIVTSAIREIAGSADGACWAQNSADQLAVVFDVVGAAIDSSYRFKTLGAGRFRLSLNTQYTIKGGSISLPPNRGGQSFKAQGSEHSRIASQATANAALLALELKAASISNPAPPMHKNNVMRAFFEFTAQASAKGNAPRAKEVCTMCPVDSGLVRCATCFHHCCPLHAARPCPHKCEFPACLSSDDTIAPCKQTGCSKILCSLHAYSGCPHALPKCAITWCGVTAAQPTSICSVCGGPLCPQHSLESHPHGLTTCPYTLCTSLADPAMKACTRCGGTTCPQHTFKVRVCPHKGVCQLDRSTPPNGKRLGCIAPPTTICEKATCKGKHVLLCDSHAESVCPHEPCGFRGCMGTASSVCKNLGLLSENGGCGTKLCSLHQSSPCPHSLHCVVPRCKTLGTTKCSCEALLCARHANIVKSPCPHGSCQRCETEGTSSCPKCSMICCPFHLAIKCKNNTPQKHASKDPRTCAQCSSKAVGKCVNGCGLLLCNKHDLLTCPHEDLVPSAAVSRDGAGTGPPPGIVVPTVTATATVGGSLATPPLTILPAPVRRAQTSYTDMTADPLAPHYPADPSSAARTTSSTAPPPAPSKLTGVRSSPKKSAHPALLATATRRAVPSTPGPPGPSVLSAPRSAKRGRDGPDEAPRPAPTEIKTMETSA